MFSKIRPPKDEEAERLERQRCQHLTDVAMKMLDAAVERHDDAQEQGNFSAAGAHSETAGFWFSVLTGRET